MMSFSLLMLPAVLFGIVSLGGCASQPIPVGTKVLGQVAYVGTVTDAANLKTPWTPEPDDALDGWLPVRVDTGTTKDLAAACGLGDRPKPPLLALVRLFYWYGSSHRYQVLFDRSEWTFVGVEAPFARGSIVELEMRQGPARNARCATVTAIRGPTLAAAGCVYAHVQKKAFGSGPYFYRSLRCPSLDSEGWKEMTDPFPWEGVDDGFGGRLSQANGNGIGWYKPPPGPVKPISNSQPREVVDHRPRP